MRIHFCLGLIAISAFGLSIEAQQQDPPKGFTNSLGMKFVWIPPGKFTMGSSKDETNRGDNEFAHEVTLSNGFYMGVHTVTQEEWAQMMMTNYSEFKGRKNLPVENVSWDDCQEFIKRLREKDKKPYRLPTEAEWEYACRAGTKTPFHFGETVTTDQVNFDGEANSRSGAKGEYRGQTMPVGTFPANAWGLHEMHGNVWQWCHDWYGDYPKKDAVDPQGPDAGRIRVLRGGAWDSDPAACRSAFRFAFNPSSRRSYFGVRLCFSQE